MQAAQPHDPYRAMLRGGAVPAIAVSVVGVVVFTILRGSHGLSGALLGAVVVLVSFGSSLLVMSRTAKAAPELVMAVALLTYVTKVGLLGVFLLVFGGASWLSGTAFSITAVAAALAWLPGELVAFTRARTLVFDDHPPADTMTRT